MRALNYTSSKIFVCVTNSPRVDENMSTSSVGSTAPSIPSGGWGGVKLNIGDASYTGEELLAKYDKNRDGKLSPSELKELLADLRMIAFMDDEGRKSREKNEQKRFEEARLEMIESEEQSAAGPFMASGSGSTPPPSVLGVSLA